MTKHALTFTAHKQAIRKVISRFFHNSRKTIDSHHFHNKLVAFDRDRHSRQVRAVDLNQSTAYFQLTGTGACAFKVGNGRT